MIFICLISAKFRRDGGCPTVLPEDNNCNKRCCNRCTEQGAKQDLDLSACFGWCLMNENKSCAAALAYQFDWETLLLNWAQVRLNKLRRFVCTWRPSWRAPERKGNAEAKEPRGKIQTFFSRGVAGVSLWNRFSRTPLWKIKFGFRFAPQDHHANSQSENSIFLNKVK